MFRQALLVFAIVVGAVSLWVATCGFDYYEKVASGIAYLPPREFDELTLITVGTGGPYENPNRRGPCAALGFGDRVVLVGAGRAVAEGLRAVQIPVQQPDTVFLPTLLAEDTVGLDDLLLTGWLAPRAQPLRVVGPSGTRALTDALLAAHGPAIAARGAALGLPGAGAQFEVVELHAAWSESSRGLTIVAEPLRGGPTPAFGYRFEAGGHAVVVGGPGWAPDALVRLARGADVLVHEAFHRASVEQAIAAGTDDPERLRREAALHTSTAEVGGLAQRAGVDTLVLVRLRPPPLLDFQFTGLIGEQFGGRVVIAADGEEFTP